MNSLGYGEFAKGVSAHAFQSLGQVWLKKEQYEQVLSALRRTCDKDMPTGIDMDTVVLAHVRELMSKMGSLQRLVDEMVAAVTAPAAMISLEYSLLGNADAGFEWLERLREARNSWYLHLLRDPLAGSD